MKFRQMRPNFERCRRFPTTASAKNRKEPNPTAYFHCGKGCLDSSKKWLIWFQTPTKRRIQIFIAGWQADSHKPIIAIQT